MTMTCFWFSGTGNSLHAARGLVQAFPGMRLVAVTDRLVADPPELGGEVVGFVFPVFAYGPPPIIQRFVRAAGTGEIGYAFVAMTHGGGPADATRVTDRLFRDRGIDVSAFFTIRMPSNYVVGSNPVEGEKAAAIFALGEKELAAAREHLAARARLAATSGGVGARFKSAVVFPLFQKGARTYDRSFFSTDACNGCGICTAVCPASNIEPDAGKRPVWRGRCEACLGCINLCPKKAVQTGLLTKGRRRYRHRDVSLQDLMNRQ
ncbi:MAG: hypothetical protein CVU65_18410 [Deltaproteobacteria bacterium HGW-Deltaproteobacteria-22]|nr:MAG: hypothetical protein CVU65_18410 [Deltaproteobacteria bacterium HGW-Deltaproteobacteria-22]